MIVERITKELDRLGIAYRMADHPAAHTVEDCKWAEQLIGARIPKNLFLTPRNLSQFYLCVAMPDAEFRTASISKQVGASRLSFGSPEKLAELLLTYPGAVSPLGLLFSEAKGVRVLIDRNLQNLPRLAFHPNDNTKSVAMSGEDFFDRFLPATGHVPVYVDFESQIQ